MNLKGIRVLLLFSATVLINVLLLGSIEERILQINCFSYETAYANLRDHPVSEEVVEQFLEAADSDMEQYSELLTMYFATDCTMTDVETLQKDISFVKKYRPEEFACIKDYVYAVWNDIERFPVGKVDSQEDATVNFENTWMQSRTFGGERGHEGTDIMASVNQRGIYPVYSITDGVVENIGWLKLGGYRIGIRSDSGAYFYYAHMAEYAKEFAIGERVEAGTFLGYMGDTGYSDIPGTTGNFAVHLHLGVYLNDEDGNEFSVNSYPVLQYLWNCQNMQLGQADEQRNRRIVSWQLDWINI